jgi:RNA polymerase sigma-70 factor (ECF subfamily)
MINDRMTAEDIVQNVFLSLYDNFQRIKNKQSINYWLFKAARNEVFMHLRRKKSHKDQFNVIDTAELESDAGYDLEDIIDRKEIKYLIDNELSNIPEEQREIFILREYGGLGYSEIAAIMDINENLVKSRLYKTRQKLINKLSGLIRQ